MKLGETVFVVKFRKKDGYTAYYTPEYGSAYKPNGWGSADFDDARKFSCRLAVDEFVESITQSGTMGLPSFAKRYGWEEITILEVSLYDHLYETRKVE